MSTTPRRTGNTWTRTVAAVAGLITAGLLAGPGAALAQPSEPQAKRWGPSTSVQAGNTWTGGTTGTMKICADCT